MATGRRLRVYRDAVPALCCFNRRSTPFADADVERAVRAPQKIDKPCCLWLPVLQLRRQPVDRHFFRFGFDFDFDGDSLSSPAIREVDYVDEVVTSFRLWAVPATRNVLLKTNVDFRSFKMAAFHSARTGWF